LRIAFAPKRREHPRRPRAWACSAPARRIPISPGLLAEADAVRKQQKAKDAVQALLPIGIGAEGGNFNKIYRDTFTKIVRNGENIRGVLREQGALLDQIFVKTNAPCWAPDPPSGKARCVVK
jgi:multiple sugar transport system substrate-binding protein